MASSPTQFVYDPRTRQYRNLSTGRFVKPVEVRAAVDHIIDVESLKIRGVAVQLVEGKIALSDWQSQTQKLLKTLHVAMGLAASGGLASTSPATLGYIGSLLKDQYKFLGKFAKEIRTGKQKLDGTLISRAALYGQSSRGTYEQVVRRGAIHANMRYEVRKLGVADHCGGPTGCVALAAKGKQPIGTLPAIGETPCGANCHCHFEFS